MNSKELYAERLKRPEWNLKRLEVLEAACFTCQRCGTSGVPLHAHHVSYVSGREPWDYPLSNFEALCSRCHEAHHTAPTCRQIVEGLAARLAARGARVEKPQLDADRVHAWAKTRVTSGAPQRAVMTFSGWLWRTGTRDMDLLMRLLEEGLRLNPESWYAYFAPGGAARECRKAESELAKGVAESQAHRVQELEFLGQQRRGGTDGP